MLSTRTYEIPRAVQIWLLIGLLMVLGQVVIGGITRITGSGLSITKWEIVTGTLPPLTEAAWLHEFELYKATPQYVKINAGMSLSDFKFIYFWEYFHRLWARLMGFVFLIPYLYFRRRNWLPAGLQRDLLIVIGLAALAASFGWIMVKSGLADRPWVNAYKLALHLCIGLSLFAYLWWTFLKTQPLKYQVFHNNMWKNTIVSVFYIFVVQLFLGGLMSGMKAGLLFPTWPQLNGAWIPDVLLTSTHWNVHNLENYDTFAFAPALVQVLHRNIAYLLVIVSLYIFTKLNLLQPSQVFVRSYQVYLACLALQIVLGIFTVLHCKGSIPLWWGVAHQAGALLTFTAFVRVYYQIHFSKHT